MEARCMKCRAQKEMKDITMVRTKKGGYMAKGICTECGCKMCKIMSKDNALQYASENGIEITE